MSGYSHLLDEERDHIAALKAVGRSIGAIAKAVGRAKSTVLRELRRNALPSGRYSPLHAAGADQRRRRRDAVLERDRRLRDFVCDRLAEGWTPEQIAGWLKAGHERGLRALGFEAIYAFVYRAARKGEELWRYLTRRHKRRRPRRARPSRDMIKDRASIHDRPRDVEDRAGRGALASDRPHSVALGGAAHLDLQANLEPGAARLGLSQALGPSAPSRQERGRGFRF